MITEDVRIPEIFNHYFAIKAESLGISKDLTLLSLTSGINDPMEKVIERYENHPRIKKIEEWHEQNQLEFKSVAINKILLQI